MPTPLPKLLSAIAAGKTPPVILVGGDNEFLVRRSFDAVREAIVAADPTAEFDSFSETTDLGVVLDSFRTMSLFARRRVLIVPEINAFVTKKEISSLLEKSTSDWRDAKTDRKRSSAVGKLLHVLGLVGLSADATDSEIGAALGIRKADGALAEMLAQIRATGKRATRGEGDAALLAESIAQGGAPGTTLLMRTGEVPTDSATVKLIDSRGAVVVANLEREQVLETLERAIQDLSSEYGVTFLPQAIALLRNRLGIERVLADKFSKEVPDLRVAVSEAERLATFVGEGGKVTPQVVEQQIATVGGGARYEFASLFTEGKPVEAVAKLRDLVAQAKREDPKSSVDVLYGRYLFALADELRQMLGVQSFLRRRGLDPRRSMSYNQFRDSVADSLSSYLAELGLVRQKPHPFPLFKKYQAAAGIAEERLVRALDELAEMEFRRKSGGAPVDIVLDTFVLEHAPGARR